MEARDKPEFSANLSRAVSCLYLKPIPVVYRTIGVILLALDPTTALQTANVISQAIRELQDYFSNFSTVQTFGGDYMFQHLHDMRVSVDQLMIDFQTATPNLGDARVQVGVLQLHNNALLDYDSRFLTVQTFGGQYLSERLSLIRDHLSLLSTL